MRDLKETEKLNSIENAEQRTKFLESFDYTDTLLTQAEKQATEGILVEYF